MSQAPVVIVGAGPVGLSAALRLSALGVPSIVLEAERVAAHDLRASTFHPPTLEMLDTLGITELLIARGLVTPNWQIRLHETGERAVFELGHIAADTRYPFRLQCEQSVLCQLAEEKAANDKAIEIIREVEVVSVEQDYDGATAVAADGRRFEGRFVIGADGGRSQVRKSCGFEFEGFTYPETTILATTKFPFQDHIAGLSNVNYCWSANGTFSLLRLPNIWRCSLYSDAGESVEQALDPSAIETKLQRIVPLDAPHEVMEIRPYRIHNRIVETYRKGNVILAGDAAHLNSPSGGMGMNGGVHDAFALAEAIAGILAGDDERLLDRYSRSRKMIAQEQILQQAHRNRTRMQERDPAARRAELARLQAICADPAQSRMFLLKSSMIEGLRQAQAMQ